ncbi:alanine--tRNA ligase [Helicobacter enhydrae]|uniref:Alanine--tRNA ligase n=1 Tax=Helicobacter enhydrae TaxID=222136 RepID=A0A1B1U4W7_9HELI|nr:alanine--tRNA ligase [Helicobacter enhydrae]ANV97781.1 alanine--tRNA ligase [Helicobacter enhydrae]
MDIRSKFLEFFSSKGHQVYASMPLVPEDNSLLFTNAGMVQFKDVFTGEIPAPQTPRATSSQLCMRAGGKHNDLENVGYTARHHTLFEMLGNFSFGDYFKEQAIAYAWEFVTEVLGFDKSVLYVTVHQSDDEAFEIWSKHIDPQRIKRLGDKDNFWQMGDTGPCGPCSEIFVDQGAEHFCGSEDYFGGDGDRFLEIWNLVFMQYQRDALGNLTPLPKPSIDTGMGLERVVALLEGKRSNFDSSIFMPLIQKVASICGKPYHYDKGASYRVIADHARSVAFLLAQGVHFDKEGRGYVLRRILRRAVRHGYLLGIKEPFLFEIIQEVCLQMGGIYPYLLERQNIMIQECKNEEERFFETLESGMQLFNKELSQTSVIFSGEVAFKLYDTYGFPLDLTLDMLRDRNLEIDMQTFDQCMSKQKEMARASWKGSGGEFKGGDLGNVTQITQENSYLEQPCYTQSKITMAFDENFRQITEILEGQKGWIVLDNNPFYPQGGGAIGDSGWFFTRDQLAADVLDSRKYAEITLNQVLAHCDLKVGDSLEARVDTMRQKEIAKHHSGTHLLHSALRDLLGEQVAQAGSLVENHRLRFDFTFSRALTSFELQDLQDRVNTLIATCIPMQTQETSLDEAKKQGAIALFSEKYADKVRVVQFGDVSCELCGGIHIANSGEIGSFYILKESGVSSGVRRIEAVCGESAYLYAKNLILEMATLKEQLKTQDLSASIQKLTEENKRLKKMGQNQASLDFEIQKIGDASVIIAETKENGKEIIDQLKNQNDKIAILLFQQTEDKVSFVAGVKNLPLKAGIWVKEIAQVVGGNGGGRDDFATAGGKDTHRLQEALQKAQMYADQILKGE